MTVTLYDFYADWCGPCKQMEPVIQELEKMFEDDDSVEVKTVDVDENQSLATEYNVRSIPTFVIERDGEIQEQLVGAQQREKLRAAIENARQ